MENGNYKEMVDVIIQIDDPQYNTCQNGYSIVRVGPVEKCKKIVNKVVSYHCPSGYSLSGTSCFKTITIKAKVK